MKIQAPSSKTFDVPTVLAIGMTVYLLKNVIHEGLGHGVGCLMVGGKPIAISSAWWNGEYEGVSRWAQRWVQAAGTVANLGLGMGLIPLFRSAKRSAHWRLFLWLMIVINLFNGAGYLLADPIGNFGDWSAFLTGLEPQLPLRIGMVALGLWASKAALAFGLKTIEPFVGRTEPERTRRAKWLCWGPYLLGGTSFTLAGFLNPQGGVFAFTSALATFGGAAFLAYLPTRMHGAPPATADAPLALERSAPWLLAGAASMAVLFALLGPSLQLS